LHRGLDVTRVLKMVLIHDIVEIDAGDTYCYDEELRAKSIARERKAAQRLFGLLPADQAQEFQELWAEFEERQTPEACFAAALDRFQPLLHNYVTEGKSWREHGINSEQVAARNKAIGEGSTVLWDCARELIQKAVERGYLEQK
ncbi:MAG: HD domain-containing protein, partial [Firmicutes bacterium]|nr:HD domain-containing protein [Bacillota bacterium]